MKKKIRHPSETHQRNTMKGIVFTEFLEMVEEQFGFLTANTIVEEADLPSGGVYTAVGTYPHGEMVALLVRLSAHSGIPVPRLLHTFGNYLFPKFAAGYGSFFEGVTDPFQFLSSIDQYIHVEVKKLYPDAELPKFYSSQPDPQTLVLEYHSERGMADFAHGLIEGCIRHFGEAVSLGREDRSEDGTHTTFILKRGAA